MTNEPIRRSRVRLIAGAATLLILLGAAGYFLFLRGSGPKPDQGHLPSLLTQEEGDLLYTFLIPTGSEELFDTKSDPTHQVNLARKRPEDTARLRRLLTERLGVKDLEDLRKGAAVDALRNLGYVR